MIEQFILVLIIFIVADLAGMLIAENTKYELEDAGRYTIYIEYVLISLAFGLIFVPEIENYSFIITIGVLIIYALNYWNMISLNKKIKTQKHKTQKNTRIDKSAYIQNPITQINKHIKLLLEVSFFVVAFLIFLKTNLAYLGILIVSLLIAESILRSIRLFAETEYSDKFKGGKNLKIKKQTLIADFLKRNAILILVVAIGYIIRYIFFLNLFP